MNITKEDLKDLAELATLLTTLKDSEEIKAIIRNVGECLDLLCAELKPRLQALSEFRTSLDIQAIKQMTAADIFPSDAVALRLRSADLSSRVVKAAAKAKRG